MSTHSFTLTGLTPLLFHADDVDSADRLKAWRLDPKNKSLSVAGDDRSPPWTWQTYLYLDGGKLVVPSECISAAIRTAGANFRGSGKKSLKAQTQTGLLILDEFCAIVGPKGPILESDIRPLQELPFAEQAEKVKDLGFDLFVKRAKVGTSKHVRVRARLKDWTITGQIAIGDPAITPSTLEAIMAMAGDTAGLLDWRPSSKYSPGPFGRFSVELKALK